MLTCFRRGQDVRKQCLRVLKADAIFLDYYKSALLPSGGYLLISTLRSHEDGTDTFSFGRRALNTSSSAQTSTRHSSGPLHTGCFPAPISSAQQMSCQVGFQRQLLQVRVLGTSSLTQSPDSKIQDGLREDTTHTDAAHPLYNWPNAISMARLVSGPAIAYLILHGHWKTALVSLAVSGASDWVDGFVARRYNQGSVIGSYLDPLADKVLICCTAAALAHEGSLYTPLAALVIGRDVFLVTGAFALRFRSLGWKWPGWQEFFRTTDSTGTPPLSQREAAGSRAATTGRISSEHPESSGTKANQQPAPFVKPLYISKINTVAQISLIGGCIASAWWGWPPEGVLLGLGGLTGGLTLASGVAYFRQHRSGT